MVNWRSKKSAAAEIMAQLGHAFRAFPVKFRRYGSGPADFVRIALKNGHWNPATKCLLCADFVAEGGDRL